MIARAKHLRIGISLLEVLISIGVVAIGLLGVSALIPIAGHQAEEGIRNERMAALGKRTFRDLRVRGFLDRTNWSQLQNGPSYVSISTTSPIAGTGSPPQYHQPVSFCLDPLLPTLSARFYPTVFPTLLTGTYNLVSWKGTPGNWLTHFDYIKEIGVSQDDLRFDIPKRSKNPPTTQVLSPGGILLKRFAAGAYSWMALIVPEIRMASTSKEYNGRYVVSVAIFENRVKRGNEYLQLPVKRFDGIAGGTVELNPVSPLISADSKAFRVGTWILVAGTKSQTLMIPGGGSAQYNIVDYQWYRILSAELDRRGIPTSLTLDGPDWRMIPSGGQNPSQVSVIVPLERQDTQSVGTILPWHVVSVYTKTIRLDGT